MPIFSRSCEYGIRAAVSIAARGRRGYVPIRAVSGDLGISFHFLTKILQKLTDYGLLESYRGPSGGVRLARPAADISLYDIVIAVDGPRLLSDCVLGLSGCGECTPCPLHEKWVAERVRLKKLLTETSLARLSGRYRRGGFRLSDLEAPG